MQEPQFIKCEPDWLADSYNESDVQLSNDSLVEIKSEPDYVFSGQSDGEKSAIIEQEEPEAHGVDVKNEVDSFENNIRKSPSNDHADVTATTSVEVNTLSSEGALLSCDACGYTFADRSTYKTHMTIHSSATHPSEQLFPCTFCDKTFVREADLIVHDKIHRKPLSSDICKKSLKLMSHLQYYSPTHFTNKTYTCSECDRTFIKSTDLKRHQMSHSGVRPYTCSECGKSFRQMSHLKTHAVIHSGDRPYSCDVCAKSFNRRDSLMLHISSHSVKN